MKQEKAQQYLVNRDLWEFFEQVNGKKARVTKKTVQSMIDYYCNKEYGDLYEHRKDIARANEQHFDMGYDLGYLMGMIL